MPAVDVVLDTNALLLPFADGIDVEAEVERLVGQYSLVVPSSVVSEIAAMSSGDGATAQAARAGTRFLKRCRVEPTPLRGDDGVLEVARRLHAVVLSNDRTLQSEARRSGLRVLAPRGAGRLHLV